jgi:hypothetical protein
MCQKHYRRWWRATNPKKNKEIEQRALEKARSKRVNWKDIDKICKVCNSIFKRSATNQIYCSKTCQNRHFFKKKMKNVQYKLRHNLRSRLRKTIYGKKHGLSPVRHLGCSIEDLKKHLESQFDSKMSWNNYGEWHIDHIKPLADFDLTDEDQFKEACHYTNLQPLWAKDNYSKGSDVTIT